MNHEPHISLLVTAGDGPAECNMAVGHILSRMQRDADIAGLDISLHGTATGREGPRSAVVVLHGRAAKLLAQTWVGTILWRMKSPLRKHHKRSNWFVGVFALPRDTRGGGTILHGDVTYSTLRAGGPGGQHQNTTDSAVRAIHGPSGLTVVVRDGRSQHRNKALALARLQALSDAHARAVAQTAKSNAHALHNALERGNPKRCFEGPRFKET